MIKRLEDIGFYTLNDERACNASWDSQMQRCEMILTDKCNFNCAYCRGPRSEWKGSLDENMAMRTLAIWVKDGLKNVRFSGGEPLLYPKLTDLVTMADFCGVEMIAVSSNGSFPFDKYWNLAQAGVNDFSISLDACCSSGCDTMSGREGSFETIVSNIRMLSKICYVSVGVVLNDKNSREAAKTIAFASSLGADDIRIISAAQDNDALFRIQKQLEGLSEELLAKHPILRYRVRNILDSKRNVRGITDSDCHKCHLMKDDSVVAGGYHFPCVIHMREHGEPIGKVDWNMREDRRKFFELHDTHLDPICKANCLDVCIDHNNKCEAFLND